VPWWVGLILGHTVQKEPRSRAHADASPEPACRRRSVKANQLTSLAVPTKNGTCCSTTIHVGPSRGSGQLQKQGADGLYYYYAWKTVPVGNITVCAAATANPRKRTNADPPDEELYTFKLSVQPTCDRKSNASLNVTQEQACPRTRTHTALGCSRAQQRRLHRITLKYPSSTLEYRQEYP
jgi:hypothetical protein